MEEIINTIVEGVEDAISEMVNGTKDDTIHNITSGYHGIRGGTAWKGKRIRWKARKSKLVRGGKITEKGFATEDDIEQTFNIESNVTRTGSQVYGYLKISGTGEKPYIAWKLEYGTEGLGEDSGVPENERELPARPYLRPAFAKNTENVGKIVKKYIETQLRSKYGGNVTVSR